MKKCLFLNPVVRACLVQSYSHFMKEGFENCAYEPTLFIKAREDGKILIVNLYVDDLIFTGNDNILVSEFKKSMKHEFDMTDLGKMRNFMGLEVLQKCHNPKNFPQVVTY